MGTLNLRFLLRIIVTLERPLNNQQMNIKAIIIVGLLSIMSGLCKAVKDTITHHYQASVFSCLGSEQFWNPEKSWKNKYKDFDTGDTRPKFVLATTVLVAATDAWHLFETMYKIFLVAAGIFAGIMAGKKYGYGWEYWTGAIKWFWFIIIVGAITHHVAYTWLFI